MNANSPKQGPPDIDEIWRRFIQRWTKSSPSSGGGGGGGGGGGSFGSSMDIKPVKVLGIVLGAFLVLWLLSGLYIVQAGSVGVILRFGRYVESTGPGPHWHLPYPIESQAAGSPVNVAQVRTVELGYRGNPRDKVLAESLMLTDDENIIDNQYAVQYTIKDPKAYLFHVLNPEENVDQVAETAIREVVGRHKMDFVLYEDRSEIASEAQHLMQQILDRYDSGVLINRVNMQNAQPPEQVQAAFDDAVKAGQDMDRLTNEGQAYANVVVPKAKGDAARLHEEAVAYKQQVVVRAEGDADRFDQILTQYNRAPNVTRQRLYQDMMQDVLQSSTKVLVDQKSQSNLLYLPLDKLMQNTSAPVPVSGNGGTTPATEPAEATSSKAENLTTDRPRSALDSRVREER